MQPFWWAAQASLCERRALPGDAAAMPATPSAVILPVNGVRASRGVRLAFGVWCVGCACVDASTV
jgi:hypothetical protein